MLKALLCRVNLGHHWLADTDQDGNFRRRCTRCGKVDRRVAKWPGLHAPGGPEAHPMDNHGNW
jgi:hypothetical protein